MPTRPGRHLAPGQKSPAEREALRQADKDAGRPTAHQRGYDGDWRALRRDYLEAFPTCQSPGCHRAAVDVDHLHSVRQRPDLRLAWHNLRSFCHPCHARRTARDQGFAQRGARSGIVSIDDPR